MPGRVDAVELMNHCGFALFSLDPGEILPPRVRYYAGDTVAVVTELPLTCANCGKQTTKPVAWVQQSTFFTCPHCGASVMIDKDLAAQLLVELESQQRG